MIDVMKANGTDPLVNVERVMYAVQPKGTRELDRLCHWSYFPGVSESEVGLDCYYGVRK